MRAEDAQVYYNTTPSAKAADKLCPGAVQHHAAGEICRQKAVPPSSFQRHAALEDLDLLVILYVYPGKWLQSGRPSTLVGVIPCSSRNTAVLLVRKKMW